MSILSLIKPVVGKPDATEDVKLVNALTAIETWANGEIDSTNLKAGGIATGDIANMAITAALIVNGAINEEKLSPALIKRLGEAVTVGAWEAVTLNAKLEAAGEYQTVMARKELGANVCRLRGVATVKGGEELNLTSIVATLPKACWPTSNILLSIPTKETTAFETIVKINTEGQMEVERTPITSKGKILFDDITFNLA